MSCDEIEVPMVKKTEGRIPILTLLGNCDWLQRELSAPRNKSTGRKMVGVASGGSRRLREARRFVCNFLSCKWKEGP